MTDPWEPFNKLRDAVKASVNPLGVEMIAWVLLPGLSGEDQACQIAFKLTDEAFMPPEAKKTKAELDALWENQEAFEAEERRAAKSEAAKNRLLDLSKGGGIFADVEDDPPEE